MLKNAYQPSLQQLAEAATILATPGAAASNAPEVRRERSMHCWCTASLYSKAIWTQVPRIVCPLLGSRFSMHDKLVKVMSLRLCKLTLPWAVHQAARASPQLWPVHQVAQHSTVSGAHWEVHQQLSMSCCA